MNLRLLSLAVVAVAALGLAPGVCAEDTTPSREMRSAWVATVWRLDWPQTVITETGNTTQINKQKEQMTTLLDSLALNNFNAINFQVRSRCDAMYKSSYEPWSTDLVGERGMDPGYDPLAYVVEECHKRGLECHAWINPYRYESVANQWDGTPQCYREEHPDWLIDVTNSSGTTSSILNPGLPEVTQRICDIIKEIVQNYDVDGVLFDDYFYLSGTSTAHDGDLYNAYTDAGGTLSIGDWRRENVNSMIAAVNNTINSVKPWVRFGVSPAGIACTSTSVANSYGIRPCPTGSDWQYSDIYSDPLAWISRQSIDFISPQIYWTRGNSTAYGPATQWWSEVAHKWDRHVYVSHSISSLTASSSAPAKNEALSAAEFALFGNDAAVFACGSDVTTDKPEYASGPNSTEFQEYKEQILLNREYNLDDAPGSIFYSVKYLYRTAPTFSHYLKLNVFTTHCLPPAMPWSSVAAPSSVENVSLSGTQLSWTAQDNMRYTVYAFADDVAESDRLRLPKYLLGVSYSADYTIPDEYASGYTFGVCAYDRYGNESSLTLPGEPVGTLGAPLLGVPTSQAVAEAPFDFEWEAVENANEYIVEVAYDADMTHVLDQRSATSTSISSTKFRQMPLDTQLYWRVRACAPGYNDGVSAAVPFTVTELRITSPSSGITDTLQPTFTYSISDREVTLEIAEALTFEDDEIIFTNTHTGSYQLPIYTLAAATEYYARARYMRNGEELTTDVLTFTTPEVAVTVPSIAFPVAGGDFYADSHVMLAPIEGPYQFRLEIAADADFPPRSVYATARVSTQTLTDPKAGSEIKIGTKQLVDGETYYAHARALFRHADGTSTTTSYGDTVPFIYRSSNSGISAVKASDAVSIDGRMLTASIDLFGVSVVAVDGRMVDIIGDIAAGSTIELNLFPGVYIVCANNIKPIKINIE